MEQIRAFVYRSDRALSKVFAHETYLHMIIQVRILAYAYFFMG